MTKQLIATDTFHFSLPRQIKISMPIIRRTLREVQAELLSHDINGGGKKLDMRLISEQRPCGMAACLGGWTSIFLLGFDHISADHGMVVDELFEELSSFDNNHGNGYLHSLFYDYNETDHFNQPNVAATAIGRYLRGVKPWPAGDMPNVLPYTKRAPAKKAKRK